MTKKTIFGFVMLSLSLVACAAQTAPEQTNEQATGTTSEAVKIDPTPEAGESCHAEGAGVTNGTMTSSGWCCGVSTCDDKETCGNEYGHQVSTCAACDYYKCNPGASIVGKHPPLQLLNLSNVNVKFATAPADLKAPFTGTLKKK